MSEVSNCSQRGVGTLPLTINPKQLVSYCWAIDANLGRGEGRGISADPWKMSCKGDLVYSNIFRWCPEAFGLGPKKVSIAFLALSLTCWLTWDKSPNLMRSLETPVPITKWRANTCKCPPGSARWWICDTWPSSDRITLGTHQKALAINPRPRTQQGAWQVKVSEHSWSVAPYW